MSAALAPSGAPARAARQPSAARLAVARAARPRTARALLAALVESVRAEWDALPCPPRVRMTAMARAGRDALAALAVILTGWTVFVVLAVRVLPWLAG